MFVNIRSSAGVAPSRLGEAVQLLHNRVIPDLVRVLGGSLVLPDSVSLLPSRQGASGPDGLVQASVDRVTGEVHAIECPRVCAADDDGTLRFALTHELAHYHELSVRRARGILLRHMAATSLWSEYFAQRVVWACAAMPLELSRPEAPSIAEAAGPHDGPGYMLTWIRAHHDEAANWLDVYEPSARPNLAIIVPGMDPGGRLAELYARFPEWTAEDVAWVDTFFPVVGRLRFGGKRRGRSRR